MPSFMMEQILLRNWRAKRSCPSTRNCSANQYRAEREPRPEGDVEPQDPTAVSSRDEHLQRLQDILGSIHLPSCSRPSDWEIRKALSDERWRATRPILFDGMLAAESCLLPTNLPESICVCNHPNLSLTAGKPVTLVTINGRYDLCLPSLCCQSCQKSWTPEVVDLLACNYWPATVSCQTIYMLDVFASFADMKVMAPALSRQAFMKLLEQRSIRCGRGGSICGDSFQKSYLEYRYCQFEVDKLCRVEHFVCPACTPDMLAVSADETRQCCLRYVNMDGCKRVIPQIQCQGGRGRPGDHSV
ncbi:hypothetical protein SKAU_G00413770 [Synaphobranchus kaupii]|uniref:CxC3 like cysteine cluster domain-containing protein n=1 Tax=Synaphobranchus kaupii TaxID=118154 RepID=A0A9Q1E6Z1_SYNKA|nr:hypothetical protein SKAU_G00413770 [Synaphobranchus kaupii]